MYLFKNDNIAICMMLCMQWVAGFYASGYRPCAECICQRVVTLCLMDAFVFKYQES